ncbi:MAG: hypothetical protein O7E52_07005, partial [Candidatus Poribacteria bacterium]|nr:hypothetical protein [Candidatus Poribacteria bacterium]
CMNDITIILHLLGFALWIAAAFFITDVNRKLKTLTTAFDTLREQFPTSPSSRTALKEKCSSRHLTAEEWADLYTSGFFEYYFQMRDELLKVLEGGDPCTRSDLHDTARVLMDSQKDDPCLLPVTTHASNLGISTDDLFSSAAAILTNDYLKHHPETVAHKDTSYTFPRNNSGHQP